MNVKRNPNFVIIGQPLRATPNEELPSIYGGRDSQKAFRVPFLLQWTDFWREGAGYFMLSGEQIWKSIWNEHKIIAWSYWLYIYAEWLSKYSIQWGS